jgi:cupin 2 domain-containing protein
MSGMGLRNLFADLPASASDAERFDTLLERPGLRIERIVSAGQSSPPGFWYDQETAEWVVLLQGAAEVRFEDGDVRSLTPGEWLYIAPHRRHRVDRTAADRPTVWLAIHFPD